VALDAVPGHGASTIYFECTQIVYYKIEGDVEGEETAHLIAASMNDGRYLVVGNLPGLWQYGMFVLGGILAVVTSLIGLTFREIRTLDLSAATTMLANTNRREGKKR
jgi:hypothetical protein